jgi:hypothetical protein
VQNLLNRPVSDYVELIGRCGRFAAAPRAACYRWLGKTLAVVTNGAFRQQGCAQLASRSGRADCVAGALTWNRALGTFS